jgi:hypothetical protein
MPFSISEGIESKLGDSSWPRQSSDLDFSHPGTLSQLVPNAVGSA